ncbi:hypothetical protein NCS56_01486800 [Fusarium sp. Ph1]|nr:hypothetical protein NCS56_01486800 [Fusarium sp. Ph1]
MAPTTSDEFEGDDFSNNLFRDLAPLLNLFGEQATKQFLSMSMGWADNVLLAMGPLGINTTIVSAIRVGGGKRLKALIGRARESPSVAEQELLSSTSQSVCEMWNGQQINEGAQILTFQKARTVGDQHFPSCAIFMKGEDLSLKFSRLNKKNYRLLVTISTSLAIVGYIVQFVGLRALHWSATIAQLGITLIMTAIRAWTRRGLASDPDWYPLIKDCELASLALIIHYAQGDISNTSGLQELINMARQPHNELAFPYLVLSSDQFWKHFHRPRSPPQTSLAFENSGENEKDTAPLRIYSQISNRISLSSIDKEASALSNMFNTVIGNVMDVLYVSGVLLWKGEASRQPSEQVVTDLISWVFDFSVSQPPDYSNPARRKVSIRLQRSTAHAEHRGALLNHDLIAALLALSAQALARRLEHRHKFKGGEKLSIGDKLFFVSAEVPCHPSSSGRIVGNTNNDDNSSNQGMLEQWLDAKIRLQDLVSRSTYQLECYLGMFLVSPLERPNRKNHLVIQTRRDSGLLLQWTQELFSIFMLAVASKVERVPGKTEEVEGKRGPGKRSLKNSFFDTIADVAVKEGLAHDRDEAYTLIVPAFAYHGLLPTCSNEQAAESTSERPTPLAPSNSEDSTP